MVPLFLNKLEFIFYDLNVDIVHHWISVELKTYPIMIFETRRTFFFGWISKPSLSDTGLLTLGGKL